MKEPYTKILKTLFNLLYWLLMSAFGLALLYGIGSVFCFASFRVPSDSMEPALVEGDHILVEKFTMGARLFDLKPAFNKERFTIHRTPALGKVKRNDILVFNFPYPERQDSIGFDVMLYYVKRCIALPGDTLEIRNSHYRVRGVDGNIGNVTSQDFIEHLFVSGLYKNYGIFTPCYPFTATHDWNIRELGPYYIPKEGGSIGMNDRNFHLYKPVIEWEQQQKLREVNDSTFTLGDQPITAYTFQKSYYFVSGDKMENSRDSRYWGVVPEEYIVGRVWGIWKSVDGWGEIRWGRIGEIKSPPQSPQGVKEKRSSISNE
ncbi:MAG: signal peptidase I [Bacteroidaceae bacterium]|nr:signal peptidase I [Bacteroidaceae bacterium]